MAGTKISELTELTTPTGEEVLVVASNGQNNKVKIKNTQKGGIGDATLIATITAVSMSSQRSPAFNISGYKWIYIEIIETSTNNVTGTSLFLISNILLDGAEHPKYVPYNPYPQSVELLTVNIKGTSLSSLQSNLNSNSHKVRIYGIS